MSTRTEQRVRNLFIRHNRTYLRHEEFLAGLDVLDEMIIADLIEEIGCGDERVYSLTPAGVEKLGLVPYGLYNYEEPSGGVDTSGIPFREFMENVATHCRRDRHGCPLPPVIHEGVLWENRPHGVSCPVCHGKKYSDYEYCLYCNRYGLLDNP